MFRRPSLSLVLAALSLACACSSQIVVGSLTSTTGAGNGGGSAASTGGAPVVAVSSASTGAGAAGVGGTGAGGTGASALCSPQVQAQRWTALVQAPIKLPGQAANLDLAGPNHMGLTIAEAEQIDCQCANVAIGAGGAGGSITAACSYGNNGEAWLLYRTDTQIIETMTLWPGYVGTLVAKSRDGLDTFTVEVNQPITKNGFFVTVEWLPLGNPKIAAALNEIHDALMATYAPAVAADLDCQAANHCVVGTFGDTAYMTFPELAVSFWVQSISAPQPTPSIVNRIDLLPM